jgi:MerR family transcriptional regulator, thiopeptide resistance regulator
MNYTVRQLARLAGVSVRTLHYYDEIGLLRPSRVADNGYRSYGEAAVLRLQQILLYKELELSLDEIRDLLDQPGFDVLHALEDHWRALQQRLGRLRRLLLTVDQTIAHVKGERPMADKDLFAFSEEQQAQYEQEAEALWGESVRASSRKWKGYSAEKRKQIFAEGEAVYLDLIERLNAGDAPGSAAVQAIVERWAQHLRYFYEPTTAIMRGLGGAYVEHPGFRAFFDKMHPRLAAYMREAIEAYCAEREAA